MNCHPQSIHSVKCLGPTRRHHDFLIRPPVTIPVQQQREFGFAGHKGPFAPGITGGKQGQTDRAFQRGFIPPDLRLVRSAVPIAISQ